MKYAFSGQTTVDPEGQAITSGLVQGLFTLTVRGWTRFLSATNSNLDFYLFIYRSGARRKHLTYFSEWCEGNEKIQLGSIQLYLYSICCNQYCLQVL